jgi:hypothetical protein
MGPAIFAQVLLATAGIVTIFDNILAATTATAINNQFCDHTHTIPLITSN